MGGEYKMRTILLLGEYLDELQDLHTNLSSKYQVQLCSLQKENIMGMIKMVRPEMAVICMLEGNNPDKDIFRWMNRYWPEIPVLIVITKGRWDKVKVLYEVGQYDKVFYPTDRDTLIQNCDILLENIDFAKEPKELISSEKAEPSKENNEQKNESNEQEYESEKQENKGPAEAPQKEALVANSKISTGQSDSSTTVQKKEEEEKKTVLLVDDSPLLLRSMKNILQDKYNVELANSGRMALNKINQIFPDIILLDYEMPGMDGSETFDRLQQRQDAKSIPVIFLTSVTERERIIDVLRKKPAGYILKPPDRQKLVEMIDEILISKAKTH